MYSATFWLCLTLGQPFVPFLDRLMSKLCKKCQISDLLGQLWVWPLTEIETADKICYLTHSQRIESF